MGYFSLNDTCVHISVFTLGSYFSHVLIGMVYFPTQLRKPVPSEPRFVQSLAVPPNYHIRKLALNNKMPINPQDFRETEFNCESKIFV